MGKKFKQRNSNLIYRIVEGSIINVQDAHPKYERISKAHRNSICKRAQGTLLAYLRQRALANNVGQNEGLNALINPSAVSQLEPLARGGDRDSGRLSPLRKLHIGIGKLAKEARINGNTEQLEAYIKVLRTIANLAGFGR